MNKIASSQRLPVMTTLHLRSVAMLLHAFVFFLTIIVVQAQTGSPRPLSEADRIALEEKLEEMQKRSKERLEGLFRRAVSDFRSAIRSDNATMDLYQKCVEKVMFTDEKRKASEFRDWRRKNKEQLNSKAMRMALRYQLSWLLLGIEAAERNGDVSELGKFAIEHLDQVFNNAGLLKEHRSILGQNVFKSVFARAYKLQIKVDDWPQGSLDVAKIYDKVVLPPFRNKTKIGSLRQAWKKRIKHEGLAAEKWSTRNGTTIGKKDAIRSSAYERFLSEKRPQLLWDMEVDCFRAGDESVAAVRMLSHLQKYINHTQAPRWIEDFQRIVSPKQEDMVEGNTVDPEVTVDG